MIGVILFGVFTVTVCFDYAAVAFNDGDFVVWRTLSYLGGLTCIVNCCVVLGLYLVKRRCCP